MSDDRPGWLKSLVAGFRHHTELRLRPPSPEFRELRTLAGDAITWSFTPAPERIIAVGDLHGDAVALASILLDREVIDKKGRWVGGETHVVLNGDVVGGTGSRLLVELVMRLEREAAENGGMVHSLLGNHDLSALKRDKRREDRTLFREHPVEGARSIVDAFRGDTEWARWLRERNAILRLGETLFAHAGINEWALHHDPARVNASIRAWIRHWQGASEEPDPRTRWTVERPDEEWEPPSSGPLWTRSFKTAADSVRAPQPALLQRILERYGTVRLVVGHAPVQSNQILLSHPVYGPRVVMIDTRISEQKRGRVSCLVIRGEKLKAKYPKRSKAAREVVARERRALER